MTESCELTLELDDFFTQFAKPSLGFILEIFHVSATERCVPTDVKYGSKTTRYAFRGATFTEHSFTLDDAKPPRDVRVFTVKFCLPGSSDFVVENVPVHAPADSYALCLDIIVNEPLPMGKSGTCTRRRASATLYRGFHEAAIVAYGDIPLGYHTENIDVGAFQHGNHSPMGVGGFYRGSVTASSLTYLVDDERVMTVERYETMHRKYKALLDEMARQHGTDIDEYRSKNIAYMLRCYPAWMHNRATFWLPGKYIADCRFPLVCTRGWWLHQIDLVKRRMRLALSESAYSALCNADNIEFVARVCRAEANLHRYVPDVIYDRGEFVSSDVATDLLTVTANDCEDFARFVCRVYFDLVTREVDPGDAELVRLQNTAKRYVCAIVYGTCRNDTYKTTEELSHSEAVDYFGHAYNLLIKKNVFDAMRGKPETIDARETNFVIMDATTRLSCSMDKIYALYGKTSADVADTMTLLNQLEAAQLSWLMIEHFSNFKTCVFGDYEVLPVKVQHDVVNVMVPDTEEGGAARMYHVAFKKKSTVPVATDLLLTRPQDVVLTEMQRTDAEYDALCLDCMMLERPTPTLGTGRSTRRVEAYLSDSGAKSSNHLLTCYVDTSRISVEEFRTQLRDLERRTGLRLSVYPDGGSFVAVSFGRHG